MKKTISVIAILIAIFVVSFSINSYAASLDAVNVTTTKEKLHPGENITAKVEFGKDLGAYTVDFAYDNNLLEYVSAEGGTADDNGTRVRVTFYDTTGGTTPRNNMSVTFKAKDVDASNPTDLSITAEGMANADSSETYDDITTPIIKSVVVEPDYKNYEIKLNYSGDVIKNEQKDMKLVVSSTWGQNYEHTRIIAQAMTPKNGTVKILGTDSQNLEHDIIQSGWGDADGEPIGGKNVVKELNVRGVFTEVGKYTIKFDLIDRDDSDKVIATKTVDVTVKEKETTNTPSTNKPSTNKPSTNKPETETKPDVPSKMPQTGNTIYAYTIPVILMLTASYVILKKKN